jgi:hypothetical protein
MRTPKSIRHFIRVENGLVPVEWIALLAGLVVAGVAVAFIVMQNTSQQGSPIGGIAQSTDKVVGATEEKQALPSP